jgi:prevent-host-death family protein
MPTIKVWSAQDAKARFSELLDTCQREGPQVVSRRGRETAVLVPVERWRCLQAATRPSLKQLLLAPEARSDGLVPARGQARRRGVVAL